MKNFYFVPLAVLGLALAFGCSKESQPAHDDSHAPKAESSVRTGAAESDLGKTLNADHFVITLSTEPAEPGLGKVTFIAQIGHHGSPAAGAKATLRPEMEGMDMNSPAVELKHVGDGKFEGEADLRMAGAWKAEVAVDQDGHTGQATFKFVVKE